MVRLIIFLKLLILNLFFFNLDSSLANQSVDQDFSFIEDEGARKNCFKLLKSGDLKFDQRSKLYFRLRSRLMGGGDKEFICNDKKKLKTAGSSFAKAMGFGSITLKNDESELGNIFTFFVLETILLSRLMNLNPYDQPAVEDVKNETKKFLR